MLLNTLKHGPNDVAALWGLMWHSGRTSIGKQLLGRDVGDAAVAAAGRGR